MGRLSVPAIAGWLFADLFLVLFIVAFSSQPTVAVPKPKLAASAPHKTTPSKAQGLQSVPVDFKLSVSPAAVDSTDPVTRSQALAQLLAGIRQELSSRHMLSRKAGFVLIFATSVDGAADPIDEAVNVATSVIGDLKHDQPGTFTASTGGEGLWAGSGEYFHFQIFFYT